MWQAVLLYVALAVLAFYLYITRNNDYWKKRGVIYIPPVPVFGSSDIPFFLKKPLPEIMMENYKKYGRLYGIFEGTKPSLRVAVPELIRDITIKDFHAFPSAGDFFSSDELSSNMLPAMRGERWKKVRALITPMFSSGKMKKMTYLVNECAETTCANFREAAKRKTPADVKRLFCAFTMDVIATVAFGTKIDSHHDPDNPLVKHSQMFFNQNLSFMLFIIVLFPWVAKLLRLELMPEKTKEFLTGLIKSLIQERINNPEVKRHDFLQLLIDEAADLEKITGSSEKKSHPGVENDNKNVGLSDIELMSQCVMFFNAGFETTGSTLSHVAYNLALNPDCQDKLVAEIKRVLKEKDNVIDYDTVKDMVYLEGVINETLRLFPPLMGFERQAAEDYILESTGITIPKGMRVGIPTYVIHHDPEFFPNPEKFEPERFLPENRASIIPGTYLPFGSGPRNCVAQRFALLEIKLCLANVVNKFKFLVAPETKIPPQLASNIGFLMPKDVFLYVEERN